jgi:hypothetical protein
MRSKLIFLAAAAVFLAFIGLSPDDFARSRAATEAPAAATAEDAAAPSEAERRLSAAELAVENALDDLIPQVATLSHPQALRYAFEAYFSYRESNPDRVRKPYLYFVDFGLDSRTPRGYVFDMEKLSIVEGPFTVAHGRGSDRSGGAIPTVFSNRRGSNATSLGLYVAQETYGFSGRSAGRTYRSVGLRLQGVSGRFNSAARERGIVVHGAPYVTALRAGRSEGCPAMEQRLAQRLLPMIANGGMVFHFSPLDGEWLREEPWVRSASRQFAAAG